MRISTFTSRDAAEFFEHFPPGESRDVIVLGGLVEHCTHFDQARGCAVICVARAGVCDLCVEATTARHIGPSRACYLAPALVRRSGGDAFAQRVAVLTAGAAALLERVAGFEALRGRRFDIQRTGTGFDIEFIGPAPFDAPPAFDVAPFLRARYGLAADPARPLVLLDPVRWQEMGGAA